MPPNASFNVKEVLRRRILNEMIRAVQPADKWKVLVVDPITLKIINSCLKLMEILDENVTLVELITHRRQPLPSIEAIYFISATPESIAYLDRDFDPRASAKPQYRAAHLFFCNGLPDSLMQTIKSSNAGKHLKTLQELFIDFHALEQRVFTLDRPTSFFRLYSPEAGGIHAMTLEIDKIAKRFACFIASSTESMPYIRYQRSQTQGTSNSSTNDGKAATLAKMLFDELEYMSKNGSFTNNSDASRSTIIIVDRSFDVAAPILHEFTYQAMVYDLLKIKNGNTYSYTAGADGLQEAILDESDSLWCEFRHRHIADTTQLLTEQFKNFLSQNKAASSAIGKSDGHGQTPASLKGIKETLAAMPQFTEMKQKYTIHINMAQECMEIFSKRKLAVAGAIEQDMATGETADGSKPKNTLADMVPLLDDSAIPPYDKVRLLMLYIMYKQGLLDEDRRKLLEHAQIVPDLAESITNLALIGVKIARAPNEKSSSSSSGAARLFRKDKSKSKGNNANSSAFELSRYQPQLRYILEDSINGSLSNESYPYMGLLPSKSSSAAPPVAVASTSSGPSGGGGTSGTSLRSTKPSWQHASSASSASNSTANSYASGSSATASLTSGVRTIVFSLGGMTNSEMRCVYELSETTRKDIIIGSTHVITPTKFIDDLRAMRDPQQFQNIDDSYGNGQGPPPIAASTKKSRKGSSKSATATTTTPSPDGDKKKKKRLFGLF